MANKFSYQVLKDDTQHAIIKLTGEFDGSGQENNTPGNHCKYIVWCIR